MFHKMELVLRFLTLAEATRLRATSKEMCSLVASHPWEEHHLTTHPDLYFQCFPEAWTLFAYPKSAFLIPPTVKYLSFAHSDLYDLPELSLRSFTALFCQMKQLPSFSKLERLDLTGSVFNPLLLAGFAGVKELVVSGCPTVRAAHLCGFPLCEKLIARNCSLTDEFLPFMPLLKTLDLQDVVGRFDHYPLPLLEEFATPVGGIPPLNNFPRLKSLRCSFGASDSFEHASLKELVVDGALVDVFKLPLLETLTLRYANLEPLRDLSHLRKLTISQCYFEDSSCLCNLSVDELVVDHCDLRRGALSMVRRVEKLCLFCCDVETLPPCGELFTCACVALKHGLSGHGVSECLALAF